VSTGQLRISGLTRDAVRHRIATGRLHPLGRAVFLVGHEGAADGAREFGAVLACPPGAVLSHRSAGAWWGICERDAETVHVTGLENSGSRPGIRFHRTRALATADRRTKHGLSVTAPARTLIDLAGELTDRDLERALDEALMARLLRESDLRRALARSRGRAGAGRLRALIGDGLDGGATRSEAERLFRRLLRTAELPAPELNVHVGGYELDALWREQRLAVEIDSYRFHGGRVSFEGDRVRDAQLTGYKVLRFTWWRLTRHPTAVAATVARELALRSTLG
jgi:very-short-patch-repair endonuclease